MALTGSCCPRVLLTETFRTMRPTHRQAASSGGAIASIFAALHTVEPPLMEREITIRTERDLPWYAQRQSVLEDRAM